LSPIFLLFQQNGKKFKYYTKLKVLPADWLKIQRVNVSKHNEQVAKEINLILDDLRNSISEIERETIFFKKNYNINTFKKKFYISIGHLAPVSGFFCFIR